MTYSYCNDQITSNAKISINDLGLLRSFGVFEYLRTYNKKLFHFHEHFLRLQNSVKTLGLNLRLTEEEIYQIILKLFSLNHFNDGAVKIIVTGGCSNDHFLPKENPSIIIITIPLTIYPKSYYSKGVKTKTLFLEREFFHTKSINYFSSIISLSADTSICEVIYINRHNHLLEGSTSNFFAIKNGYIITPKENILLGITREVILSLCSSDFLIEFRNIHIDEISFFDEAFICASNKEIIPVVKIDNKIIKNGLPGPITKKIMKRFKDYTNKSTWPKLNYRPIINL